MDKKYIIKRNGLRYVDNGEVKSDLLPHHKAGLQYTQTGYGSKIPSEFKTKVGNRWYRIYYMIYSNSGTSYIISSSQDEDGFTKKQNYIVNNMVGNYNV